MSSAGRAAVRLARARLEVPGPVGADRLGLPPRLRRREPAPSRRATDGAERRGRLARRPRRRTTVALIQAGTFRSDAGTLFGPVPRVLWDDARRRRDRRRQRLLQALNCLLIETPSGRVLVETGIGERVDDKTRAMRGYEGPCDRARARDGGLRPETIDVVAMSHLHFDHAGGLLRADGAQAFPARRSSPRRRSGRSRSATTRGSWRRYVQPELALVERLGRRGLGRRRAGAPAGRGGGPDRRPLAGHQAIVVRGRRRRPDAGLLRRPVHAPMGANPRWVTAFDDFPLDSVERKAELFAQAADEGWLSCCRTSADHPIGRLVRDRDRFRFEPV